jgi:hypothetical protein
MENQMIETDAVKQALSVAGWDHQAELDGMTVENTQLELPRVRIEHKDNGKHRMYIDSGESYLESDSQEVDIPDNKLTAVVFAEQFIRAYWDKGRDFPLCSSINNRPIGPEVLSDGCKHCVHGAIGTSCKPKVRLLILAEIDGEIKPLIMNLSPTSIKHWNAHKRRLQRSNLPVVAVNTTFELEDAKKGSYRWATVRLGMDGITSKETLVTAKVARFEFESLSGIISQSDFDDAGDRN